MTIYEYLKLKYNEEIVDKIFNANNNLDKSKELQIVGARGCETSTIQALEIALSDIVFGIKYRAMTDGKFQDALYSEKDFDQKLIIHVETYEDVDCIESMVKDILESINYSEPEVNNE